MLILISSGGYEWNCHDGYEYVLQPVTEGSEHIRRETDNNPNLYTRFSSLVINGDDVRTRDRIVKFANKYGFLLDAPIQRGTAGLPGESAFRDYEETYMKWCHESCMMKKAVFLLRAIAEEDIRSLRKLIKWDKGYCPYIDLSMEGSHWRSKRKHFVPSYALRHIEAEDYLTVARYLLAQLINEYLRKWVMPPRMQMTIAKSGFYTGVQFLPYYEASLLGAMWMQLMQDFMNVKSPIRKCLGCGKPLVPKTKRCMFHNGTCRQRYNRRQKLTMEIFSNGSAEVGF